MLLIRHMHVLSLLPAPSSIFEHTGGSASVCGVSVIADRRWVRLQPSHQVLECRLKIKIIKNTIKDKNVI